ncbi:MAG: hypothetical protein AAF847_14290 [Bacteroidota bacterium]
MLRIDVQASAINNLTDARYFAAREAKYLCFNIGVTDANTIAAIKAWVDGVEIVVAFDIQDLSQIVEAADFLELSILQLGSFYTNADAKQFSKYRLIKELIVPEASEWDRFTNELAAAATTHDYLLLDFHKNGIRWKDLSPIQIQKIRTWCQQHSIILSLIFQADDTDAVLNLGASCLDLKGSEEEKVGYKSFEELDDILDALEIEM